VVVLCGDNPLITAATLRAMMDDHKAGGNAATVLTADVQDPTGLGRVIRNGDGTFREIREHKDADEEILKIREINASVYCFDRAALDGSLGRIGNDNAQHEYYLPEALKIILSDGGRIGVFKADDYTETLGINTPEQLANAESIMQSRR
jgi:bifunctional UDP-N-acetylglucosamine pyrophosphorylase/glucosamine-1-phosphate N-acetyltransferase